MPRVGFEQTIPVFEQVKAVHALDCAATTFGCVSETPITIPPPLFLLVCTLLLYFPT
jgi:hypothetical protein